MQTYLKCEIKVDEKIKHAVHVNSTLSKSKWPMVESNHIYLFELNTIGGHLYRGTNLHHRNPPFPPSLEKLLLNRLDAVATKLVAMVKVWNFTDLNLFLAHPILKEFLKWNSFLNIEKSVVKTNRKYIKF